MSNGFSKNEPVKLLTGHTKYDNLPLGKVPANILQYFRQILDATNTTQDRRDLILERCQPEGIQVMFIESVLDDALIEESNIRVSGSHGIFVTADFHSIN
jgi:hypothetical protein